MEIKEVTLNGISTTLIKTSKFKTINIHVVFLGEFSKETATRKSLLTRVLANSTKKYPTKKALATKLLDLYDASAGVVTYPSGKTSVTVFSIEIVNEKNLGIKGLTKEAVELLWEVIFNPNLENGLFSEKDFLEQKRLLRERLNNVYNNKTRYALREMLKKMAPEEIISASSLGSLEDLEKVTNEDLVAQYKEMLEKENVSLYVCGDFEEESMLRDLSLLGEIKSQPHEHETVLTEPVRVKKVREYFEKQKIKQAKLIMGFRSDVNSKSELYPAALVFNAMYGGIFASDLIRLVREENSLAYTITSMFMDDVMVLVVAAGIDGSKYQLTTDLVIKQLEYYKQGGINPELLQTAKENLTNDLLQIEDNPVQLINFALKNYLHGLNYTVSELEAAIKAVTPEDVQRVALGVNLDTIFLLVGEDDDGKKL
ncbi:MAG: pitrilysin family protein [Bacilli bacterium]|jgi:predicted Zn-dependent peptidase|nr:insulinase family protein [Acholeplasmataceae bacterium]